MIGYYFKEHKHNILSNIYLLYTHTGAVRIKNVAHEITFQQTRHPYTHHEQQDIADSYSKNVESGICYEQEQKNQKPPIQEEENEPEYQADVNFIPDYFQLFDNGLKCKSKNTKTPQNYVFGA